MLWTAEAISSAAAFSIKLQFRCFQSRFFIWSLNIHPLIEWSVSTISKGYPFIWLVIGQNNASPIFWLYCLWEIHIAGRRHFCSCPICPVIDKRQKLFRFIHCRIKVFDVFDEECVQIVFFKIPVRKVVHKGGGLFRFRLKKLFGKFS